MTLIPSPTTLNGVTARCRGTTRTSTLHSNAVLIMKITLRNAGFFVRQRAKHKVSHLVTIVLPLKLLIGLTTSPIPRLTPNIVKRINLGTSAAGQLLLQDQRANSVDTKFNADTHVNADHPHFLHRRQHQNLDNAFRF